MRFPGMPGAKKRAAECGPVGCGVAWRGLFRFRVALARDGLLAPRPLPSPRVAGRGERVVSRCARRFSYWQTSTLTLSTYMPFGAGAVVFESETARQRSCSD